MTNQTYNKQLVLVNKNNMQINNKAFKHTSCWLNVCMIEIVVKSAENTKYQTHNGRIFGILIRLNKSLHSKHATIMLT